MTSLLAIVSLIGAKSTCLLIRVHLIYPSECGFTKHFLIAIESRHQILLYRFSKDSGTNLLTHVFDERSVNATPIFQVYDTFFMN